MNAKVPSPTIGTIESLDPLWTRLRKEAEAVVANHQPAPPDAPRHRRPPHTNPDG